MAKRFLILFAAVLVLTFLAGVGNLLADPLYEIPFLGLFEKELEPGEVYVIKDQDGKVLSKMARVVYDGDELIAEDNKHYKVKKVEGKVAYAEYVGEHDIDIESYIGASALEVAEQGQNSNNLIAIYHTHSDESYVPDDGTESKPANGGIFDVGEAFSQKLREKGINVIQSKASHEPHDSNAYKRSRRTAVDLMGKGPSILIDIHRDGIQDPGYYNTKLFNVDATKTRLVVGRQNQNMYSNLEFAKKVKARINEIYPGLVKEIFIAKGNYNQDLSPRTLLIEVGTHTNDKDKAENGAMLFADALPQALGLTPGGGAPGKGLPGNAPQNRTDWTSILLILGTVIIGGGAFLLLSSGSLEGAKEKLKQFTSSEWANFMGGVNKRFKRYNVQESNLNNKTLYIEEVSETGERPMEPKETNDERAEYQKD